MEQQNRSGSNRRLWFDPNSPILFFELVQVRRDCILCLQLSRITQQGENTDFYFIPCKNQLEVPCNFRRDS